MPLKKPGDFFQKKEVVKIKEEIDQLVNPELSSVSDAYEKYKDNVNKFQSLSDSIENLQKEIKDIKVEVYKKEEETWSEINRRVSIFYKKFHFLNLSVSIPLYKLLLEKGYKEQVINTFFNQFSEGSNLDIDNPMLSLRNQMMQKAFRNRGSSNQRYLLNALISLFNMYINNEKRTSFRAPASDISDVLKIQDPLPCHIA